MAAFCGFPGSLLAQTGKTITLRMLEAKTGRLIATSHFLVRLDHEKTVHADWVVQNEDGTGKLTVPRGASVLSIQATYDSAMRIFVNCDSDIGEAEPSVRWYAFSEILTTGIVAANRCGTPKAVARLRIVPRPGEFVFFVRKQNVWEEAREFSSQ
jgi:hypothetical protein